MNAFLTVIEKFKLDTKLILGFSSGLLIAAAIGFYSMSSLEKLEAEMERIYEYDLLGISHIQEANINLIYMGRALRQMMIAQDDMTRDKARAQVSSARQTLQKEMDEARKRIFRADAIAKYEQFTGNFNKFNENVEYVLTLIEREKANPSVAAKFVTSPEFIATVNAADDDLTQLTKIKESGSKATIEAARQRSEETRRIALLLLVVGILLAVSFGVLIGASIKRPNDRLRSSVERLAEGDVASPIPHADYPNEIGILARAIQVLQGIYRKAEDTRWIKTHAAEIAAALQQAEDFKGLAQTAISRIAPLINAGHGAVYVMDGERRLNLFGSYGYRERKHLNNSFMVGEGLIGQAAMEKTAITLTAPKDYIRISSGLGEGPPACVAVLPIIHQERVLAVLEIASFQQFSERETALLDALMPVLATNMEIMDRNQRTKELLVATQEQAERMEKQAAQLEEQSVEMEAQQAELLETENWFRCIIETAMDGRLVVDESGAIVLSNPQAERLFGYASGEMLGVNANTLMPGHFLAEKYAQAKGTPEEAKGMAKDGAEFPIIICLSPLPAIGNRGRCMSIAVRAAGAN
ncbi:MAG: MCP four helix bundle domain-containing protein [Sterolibacterium sp.]